MSATEDVGRSALAAALERCAVVDLSHLTRLVATGPDILDLLHRLSSGDVRGLEAGHGAPTVLTSAKGRIVERLFVHHLGADGVLIVAGAGAASRVLDHLKRYTFAERIDITDRTAATASFAVIGPAWERVARAASLPALAPWGAATVEIRGVRAHLARSNGFDATGLQVVAPRERSDAIRGVLVDAATAEGGAVLDAAALEPWRIARGLPASGAELNEDHNPLEAGLYDAVSFTKGCYVGQEVVARLNTYDKVSRALVRLELEPALPLPEPGAAVRHGGKEVGAVTSAAKLPGEDRAVALAYIRSRDVPAGSESLSVDGAAAPRTARIIR